MPIPAGIFAASMIAGPLLDQLMKALFGPKIPGNVKELQRVLTDQGISLASSPGLSQTLKDAMFGPKFENIMAAHKNLSTQTTEAYGRGGGIGTGGEIQAQQKNAWAVEGNKATLARELMALDAEMKVRNLSVASSILGGSLQPTMVQAQLNQMTQGPDIMGGLINYQLLNELGMGTRASTSTLGTTALPAPGSFGALPTAPMGSDLSADLLADIWK
jgi:hypothetical protein